MSRHTVTSTIVDMVDLNMPPGMTDDERMTWLHKTGEALVRETGMPNGVTENQEIEGGQPVWGLWWTNRTEAPDGPTDSAQREHPEPPCS